MGNFSERLDLCPPTVASLRAFCDGALAALLGVLSAVLGVGGTLLGVCGGGLAGVWEGVSGAPLGVWILLVDEGVSGS
jgi:hypothetical protein